MFNIEPHADIRNAAATAFQLYVAFEQAGFTEEQAFRLVRDTLVASAGRNPEPDDK